MGINVWKTGRVHDGSLLVHVERWKSLSKLKGEISTVVLRCDPSEERLSFLDSPRWIPSNGESVPDLPPGALGERLADLSELRVRPVLGLLE